MPDKSRLTVDLEFLMDVANMSWVLVPLCMDGAKLCSVEGETNILAGYGRKGEYGMAVVRPSGRTSRSVIGSSRELGIPYVHDDLPGAVLLLLPGVEITHAVAAGLAVGSYERHVADGQSPA